MRIRVTIEWETDDDKALSGKSIQEIDSIIRSESNCFVDGVAVVSVEPAPIARAPKLVIDSVGIDIVRKVLSRNCDLAPAVVSDLVDQMIVQQRFN